MKRRTKVAGVGGAVLLLAAAYFGYYIYVDLRKAMSEEATVWEQDIVSLERNAVGAAGSVLFVGSSSIRLWDSLHQDMAPMRVIQRGFGGAKINDVVHYANRLFAVEDPSAIVIFVGTNDLHPGAAKEPEIIVASFREMMARLRAMHPRVPVFYIAITPSLSRWEVWPQVQETNRLIAAEADKDSLLQVIDTGPALLRDGQPDEDNYVFDGLHLSEKGYAIWTRLIRAALEQSM